MKRWINTQGTGDTTRVGRFHRKRRRKKDGGGGLNGEEYLEDRWIRRENRVIEQRIQRKGG